MSSNASLDIEKLKTNCLHYARSHSKAVAVLKAANGKDGYKQIAKAVGMHETRVSGLLRSAEKFGLATKKGGVYKKLPGILQYIPKTNSRKNSQKALPEIIEAVAARKTKSSNQNKTIAFGVSIGTKAQQMADAYIWLYLTENIMRELIRHVLGGIADWWNNNVNEGIKKDVEEAKAKYPYDGAKRRDELEYTHLGQLKEIIASKINWELFLPSLKEKDKSTFQAIVNKAIPSRNSLAHCTPLSGEDFKFVEVRFKDILKMIDYEP